MSTAAAPSASVAPASLLIVDDEAVVRTALRELLSAEGYAVVTAAEAVEGLEQVRRQPFAMVLTDQRMPGMTGLEFLTQVKALQPEATRVLMTGVLELGTVIESINSGEIFRFLVKPWLREEILATTKNSVQRFEMLRRNTELHEAARVMNEHLAGLNRSLEQQMAQAAQQNRQLELLNHALEQNLHRSVQLCLKMLETFYPALGAQARQAGDLCRHLADGLQLPAEQRAVLELSACLHDVGLVGVSRRVISLAQRTPGALTRAERALVEQHPVLGQELAGFVHHLAEVGLVIRSHHERFDGSGYPDQLAGDEIPWLARLLAVVACFVEGDRDVARTLEGIERSSGTGFDPEAVRVFLRYRPEGRAALKERPIPLSELKPGMVLAKGIYTSNGMLLIPGGQVLNEPQIDKLRNHNRVNPIRQSLLVYG